MFPAIVLAGNIGVVLENHQGESFYKVESPTQNLEAKLSFPFELNTLGLFYSTDVSGFNFFLKADLMLNSKITIGKDYDWYNDNLTVFSASNNKIDKFNSYSIAVSTEIFQKLNITSRFQYKKMDMSWSNTVEHDFVQNETSTNESLSLEYKQDFYQLNLGLNYEISIFDYLQLELDPSFIYTYIEAKDSHILRNFYTMQYSKALGYGLKANILKQITDSSKILIDFEYETYSDKDTKMYYYNSIHENYLTLPSSYKYESSSIGLSYVYMF